MSLEIHFNHSDNNYTTGDVVSGQISLNSGIPLKIFSLKATMFLQCRIITLVNLNGISKTSNRTHLIKTLDLIEKATVVSNSIPFTFPAIPIDFPSSFESEKIFCRYFIKVELTGDFNKIISSTKNFKVSMLPLDYNPKASGYQTKSDFKMIKFKKLGIKVTTPTAIDRRGTIPIQISISNPTTYPAIQIRSRLICTIRLPRDINKKNIEITANENQEFINIQAGCVTHLLKVHTGFSFNCPLISETFKIHVEVEISNGVILKVDLPVILGKWKNISRNLPLAPPSYEEAMGYSL